MSVLILSVRRVLWVLLVLYVVLTLRLTLVLALMNICIMVLMLLHIYWCLCCVFDSVVYGTCMLMAVLVLMCMPQLLLLSLLPRCTGVHGYAAVGVLCNCVCRCCG